MSLTSLNKIHTMASREKLEVVSFAWGQVQEENENHRSLVTQSDWNNWLEYDKFTTKKLSKVIDNFNGSKLAREDETTLDDIASTIMSAQRMNESELISRLEDIKSKERARRESAERKEQEKWAQNIIEDEKKKKEVELKNFKKGLFSFFKRK